MSQLQQEILPLSAAPCSFVVTLGRTGKVLRALEDQPLKQFIAKDDASQA